MIFSLCPVIFPFAAGLITAGNALLFPAELSMT